MGIIGIKRIGLSILLGLALSGCVGPSVKHDITLTEITGLSGSIVNDAEIRNIPASQETGLRDEVYLSTAEFEIFLDTYAWMHINTIIKNKTNETFYIDWDKSSLIDTYGEAHRIVTGKVSLNTKNNPQIPTPVTPGAKISETIFPADYLYYDTTMKAVKSHQFLVTGVEDDKVNSAINRNNSNPLILNLAIKTQNTTNNIQLKFKVTSEKAK